MGLPSASCARRAARSWNSTAGWGSRTRGNATRSRASISPGWRMRCTGGREVIEKRKCRDGPGTSVWTQADRGESMPARRGRHGTGTLSARGLVLAIGLLFALDDLVVPARVVAARPRVADRAPRHGLDRALDPDRRIDVDRDGGDEYEAAERVQQRGHADDVDVEEVAEVRAPHDDAGQQQADHAGQQRPEQHLLPGVVAADLGQAI